MSELDDWNAKIIAEFRANGGKVGGPFADATLLLLTTTGARTGKRRTHPLICLQDGDRVVVFASRAGAPKNPDWYHNLRAHPRVTVELGTETFEAEAVVQEGRERDRLYAAQVERSPVFGEYQAKTTRQIPVIALERVH
jgi:deazaflavin-dependent oxidoreductase (nitroreductase family)